MELVVVQAAAEILPALVEQAIVRLEVLLKEMQVDKVETKQYLVNLQIMEDQEAVQENLVEVDLVYQILLQ